MISSKIILACSAFFLATNFTAQTKTTAKKIIVSANKKENTTTPIVNYEYALNDPLKARIYTLKNGLKVYMTVYKDAPRIQTYIAVKAGSKNDPSNATGLAHYLEHMVFKGTDKYGSKNFAKESVEITKIENLYEVYRATKDATKRKAIYHKIDSISGVAAKYAIANEYDKLLAGIGGEGTNAFTGNDQTVYVNDIPSNQLESWLKIESERFRKLVLRLFHTELEAVYEEKNRALDDDGDKSYEALLKNLFKKHTYGTQTTIGTIEHLKNPSMKEIKTYFNTYYVPNNMTICLSGDFDPDATIKLIEKHFGLWASKPVVPYSFEKEEAITQKIIKEVVGPDVANVMMGWRFEGEGTKEVDIITLISNLLANGTAGLMDLNLNQQQKVLSSASFTEKLKDYSIHVLYGQAKEGQTLEEVEKLLFSQIELLKKGEFPDWLLGAVVTNLKLEETKKLENNSTRAKAFVDAFTNDIKWQNAVNTTERLVKITKQDIIEFANKNYTENNYVVVYKRVGEDTSVQKVDKPQITPVAVNRDDESAFVTRILDAKVSDIAPKFIDYDKDIIKTNIHNNIPLLYNQNTENDLFNLYYSFNMGSNNSKLLPIATDYISYLGTSIKTPAEVQQEFYKLGCSFNVFVNTDQTYVSLSGLNENFGKATALFESLFKDPKVDEKTLRNLIADVLKKRSDDKQNKDIILQKMMRNYAIYGANNPSTDLLSEAELNKLTTNEVAEAIKTLLNFEHTVLYYGPNLIGDIKETLELNHNPTQLTTVPKKTVFNKSTFNNTVYVVDYDMTQAEVVLLTEGEKFDKSKLPLIELYNEYFGGGMSSVFFQDLRESKALAYSCYSIYRKPTDTTMPYYNMAYIGSQADKLKESLQGVSDLLNDMPKSENSFSAAKELILQGVQTERINKENVLFEYLEATKFGLKTDSRKEIYTKLPTLKFEDIKQFQNEKIKNKPSAILILGKKGLVDTTVLEKYGIIKYLTLTDIFGY